MTTIPPHAFLAATPNICRQCGRLGHGCNGSIPPVRDRPHLTCEDYTDAKKEILTFSGEHIAPIIHGRKNASLRLRPHGKIGDTFIVAGITYRITAIIPFTLSKACLLFYTTEGCDTPDVLEQQIRAIYPEVRPQTHLFLHLFAAVICK